MSRTHPDARFAIAGTGSQETMLRELTRATGVAVATAAGGLPEVVEDGVTGILVPPSDADALAEAIATLLSDSGMREDMGAAGQQRAREHFSLQAILGHTFSCTPNS